jgi:phosphoribosylamine---glycine ligase
MRILVIGSGGREHAICRALATSSPAPELVCAPGNGGTRELAKNVAIALEDVKGLVELALAESVDLVVVGPELPLVLGLADELAQKGVPCVGPRKEAARLEGSKAFMRRVADAVGAPSPHFVTTRREAELAWALDAWEQPPVVKADGLASGKGVFLPKTKHEALEIGRRLLRGELGPAGSEIVLEERLAGVEASLFFACDGTIAVPLPHARDHKRIFDNEQGPNTGGMGAVSPSSHITPALLATVQKDVVRPVLAEMTRRGAPFRGFLFAGLMLTREGPKLLEFNVRLGDPEAQAILPRLAPGAFTKLCEAIATGGLQGVEVATESFATCAVVLAARGYPDAPELGEIIHFRPGFPDEDRWIDQAGTKRQGGDLVTSGGRVLSVVARGDTAQEARQKAYEGIAHIEFAGMHYRRDIGGPS